jgi:DnaJ-class molecular chaperone
MVNIPWGFHKRLVRVSIPPGLKKDTKLRLKGLGRLTTDGQKGDLFLKVVIKS